MPISKSPTQTALSWWLSGDEECPHCHQLYAYEIEVRCPACDGPSCPHCVALHVERGIVCMVCRDDHEQIEESSGAARAIWKGRLQLGKEELDVKLYSAIEDRTVRFHLLHAKDRAPVEQHIVRKDTGKDVAKDDMRKAFALDRTTAVILEPEDLEKLAPPESRDIEITRFVATSVLGDQWYDRPYFLGPDADDSDYFALAEALDRKEVVGIARWVMRKKRYVGALTSTNGYLMLSTLRRADQVLSFSGIEPAKTNAPAASELKLAQQLVSSIESDFDPAAWTNEYRERLHQLIEAKARGEKIEPVKQKKKAASADLADSLRASIAAVKEKKVA